MVFQRDNTVLNNSTNISVFSTSFWRNYQLNSSTQMKINKATQMIIRVNKYEYTDGNVPHKNLEEYRI